MTGPVEVLAVLAEAAASFDNIRFERRHESTELQTEHWNRRIYELIEARAAVAELIEAVSAQQTGGFCCQCSRCTRVRAALANVGGAK